MMKKLGSLIVSRMLSQQSRWLMLILLLGLAAAGLVLAWNPPVTADDDDDDKSELLVSNIEGDMVLLFVLLRAESTEPRLL
jgi:hypothetical protein